MAVPSFTPSLATLTYPGVKQRLAQIADFYKRFPNAGVVEVGNDGPDRQPIKLPRK